MSASTLIHPPTHSSSLSKPLKRTRSTIQPSTATSSLSSSPSPHSLSSSPFTCSTQSPSRAEDDDDPLYSAAVLTQRRHPRLSYPPYPYHLPPSHSSLTSTTASSSPSSSSTSSSPFLSHSSTPSISPLSPALPLQPSLLLLSRRSSSPISTSPTTPTPPPHPHHPPSPSLKRLCIDDSDDPTDTDARTSRRRKVDADHALLISFSSFSLSPRPPPQPHPAPHPTQSAVSRVIVRGKRSTPLGLPFASTPLPSHLSPPVPTPFSLTVSPAPGVDGMTGLSSSLPSTSSFLLAQLITSSSSSSSSSSPMHSPTSSAALPSTLPTPSSASSTTHRPRLISPQERAALFPSRSVSSSPLPPPSLASAAARRVSTGKRPGLDSPSSASSHRSHTSGVGQLGGRGSKRVKEDRRRDRRCSFAYTDEAGHLLPNVDDEAHELSGTSPSPTSRLTLLMMGSPSSFSHSSLDSPSYSSYPSATAPLNSPVSGGQRRRLCHIVQGDLLGTAAAAASVARRGQGVSLYGSEDEVELVDAVEKCHLEEQKQPPQSSVEEKERPVLSSALLADEDEAEEVRRLLPAAPRLATRSTSLRVSVLPSTSSTLLPVALDDEDDELGQRGLLELSPGVGRAVSATSSSGGGGGFSEFIRTGSFSQAVRSARQRQSVGSSRTSSASSSPFPATPEPILSPLSSSLVAPPGSPTASASASSLTSFPLPSALHQQPPLSPFTLLPSSSPSFARSLSMGVMGVDVARRGLGWIEKSRASVAGSGRRRMREGEAQGEDVVPFLKELSLPPRAGSGGTDGAEVVSGMLARFRASRAGRMEV